MGRAVSDGRGARASRWHGTRARVTPHGAGRGSTTRFVSRPASRAACRAAQHRCIGGGPRGDGSGDHTRRCDDGATWRWGGGALWRWDDEATDGGVERAAGRGERTPLASRARSIQLSFCATLARRPIA
eukprot:gene18841-biopygen2456